MMLVRQPQKEDKLGVYELYYLKGIGFAKLDEGSLKAIKRAESRVIKKNALAKTGVHVQKVQSGGRRLAKMMVAKAVRSGDKVRA